MILGLACADPVVVLDEAEPTVEVRDWLGSVSSAGGTIAVQVESAPDAQVQFPDLEVEGLEIAADGEPRVERIGDRSVETRFWKFKGESGHYIVPAPSVPWKRGTETGAAEGTALYFDLATDPLKVGDIGDIVEPDPVRTVPWGLLGGGALVGALVFVGLYVAFRSTKAVAVVKPPEAPDILALRAWASVRKDGTLSDFDKALALSRIFREYVEATLHFPATKNTTPETLQQLTDLPHLPEGNVTRAKRLLRATDRVKYADATPGADVFDDLDADLRAFIADTRPSSWERP
jgi:hypothetical protein